MIVCIPHPLRHTLHKAWHFLAHKHRAAMVVSVSCFVLPGAAILGVILDAYIAPDWSQPMDGFAERGVPMSVPEPSTIALLLPGILVVGWMMRGRK
ncbi:MAG TPA: PEP-CTERM sorting domain-containing protein [Aliidongia sp.]|uniref:PEP-CTERM sorting domain-containing protein n=1 Tax=Aliidongia sp. TaxID=1914230 RepID=UPI002DDCFA4C|nr:PEP-CTERM sorting domain-containing protein [Aliidongia sp.]HEV2674124.1 PEP-CTERM sorting domain-containing protein [Aliidongia sp.]